MKAILEYLLPEEQEEFELAMHGGLLAAGLDDFSQYLRQITKYEGDDVTKEQLAERQVIREKFYEILGEYL